MGERRLRDLTLPEHIYLALAVGLPTISPPQNARLSPQ